MFRFLGAVFLVLTSTIWVGGVYRWVDDQGVTHYSDTPPPGGKSRQVEVAPGPSSRAVEEAQRRQQDLEEHNRRTQKSLEQQAESKGREQEQQVQRRENACKALRHRLSMLQAQVPVAVSDAKGGIVWLTDEQITQQAASVQQQVRELCE